MTRHRNRLIGLILAGSLATTLAAPSVTQASSGGYLAARQAIISRDYEAAVTYFADVLEAFPNDRELLENALVAYVTTGRFEEAVSLARRLDSGDLLVALLLLADDLRAGRHGNVQAAFDAGLSFSPIVDGLIRGWVLVSLGRMTEALDQFDGMTDNNALRLFGQYHKALALAVAGDFESAAEILDGDARGPLRLTRGSLIAHVQILAQLDRTGEALALLDEALEAGSNGTAAALRARLAAGEPVAWDFVTDARSGAAQVFLTISAALAGERDERLSLYYARMADYLRPDDTDVLLLLAALFEQQGQHRLALESYERIPAGSPVWSQAVTGRALALAQLDRVEEAVDLLSEALPTTDDVGSVAATLGDILRRESRFDEAAAAYDLAVEAITVERPQNWLLYYARAIARERSGNWPGAEADFRAALALNPNQPLVLNYLGYSLVEQRTNLEEAEEMIRRAVAGQPNDGYIIDSLGWVLYRLGRFEEAVEPMEKAVELLPNDPIINDHLGDVYWKVGRKREAVFQWRRALWFAPHDDLDEDRVRRKIEVGLDEVLAEEREAGN